MPRFLISALTVLLPACLLFDQAIAQTAGSRPQRVAADREPAPVKSPAKRPAEAPAKPGPDELAIRKSAETYMQAYARGDAKAVAAHFTTDGEYVDETGVVTQGRAAIETELVDHFRELPGAKLEIEIESIRFLAPGVAIEDGITHHTHDGAPEPVHNLYTAVHARVEGKWLVASVRDSVAVIDRTQSEELKQLAWLVGDWVDEDEESITKFSCQVADGGNYLIREFTITMEGRNVLTGNQRITWDPRSGQFRSWTFDSDGGFAQGVWHRDKNRWVVKSTGQTAQGESAAMTNVYTLVNDHTVEMETTDFVIDAEVQEVTPRATLVRAPAPRAQRK